MLNEKKSIHEVAVECLALQSASSLAALVRTWSAWMPVIIEHSQEIGISWNEHPINQVMVDKLSQLSGLGLLTVDGLQEAYEAVFRLAEE